MSKLEKEELETEAAWESAVELAREKQSKLKRLRDQKRFLKEKEQKMFDKSLDDVEELERLEDLERASEIERVAASSLTYDVFSNSLSPDSLNWLPSFPSGTVESTLGNSSNA